MFRLLRRLTLVSLAVAVALFSNVSLLRAQVQRQPSGGSSVQLDPNAVRAMVDPLKAEVQNLRAEVSGSTLPSSHSGSP